MAMAGISEIDRIYTDGSCLGNPGPGGWGLVVYFNDGSTHELGGADPESTNNRMELKGAIAALELVSKWEQTAPITIYTDSEYLRKGLTQWLRGWKQKGWKNAQGKPVLNQDLWKELDDLQTKAHRGQISIRWRHVRGHSGNAGNERCDEIARAFAAGHQPALDQAAILLELQPERRANSEAQVPLKRLEEVAPELQNSVACDSSESLPHETRVLQLRYLVETLRMADEVSKEGYLMTSSELGDLMNVNASAVTSRGDSWIWRNWVISRVRREDNQILWQLERAD